MALLVDTSVWSLALRRDAAAPTPEVAALQIALLGGDAVVTTGVVIQELLQGFSGPKARDALITRLSALECALPTREDHNQAAEIRNSCRRAGVQIGTIDALLIALCQRDNLTLLSADRDFVHAREHVVFRLWQAT